MRKHWLVPCSVIKWWPDGVRGRETISTGLCAPGQRNIVRCFKQYGYLRVKLFCKDKAGRQIADVFFNEITAASVLNRNAKHVKVRFGYINKEQKKPQTNKQTNT